MLDQTNHEKFYWCTDFRAIIVLECRNFKSMECLYVLIVFFVVFCEISSNFFLSETDVAKEQPYRNQNGRPSKINNVVKNAFFYIVEK